MHIADLMKSDRNPELITLGKRLARLRRAKGLSMERLAYEAEISKGNLCDIEAGRRNPRYCTLKSIAGALGIPLSQMLQGL